MIIHANALDVPRDLFAECDVLLIDPPYSEHVHANATSVGSHDGRSVRPREFTFAALSPALRDQIAVAAMLVRRWSAIFSDVESTHEWRAACMPPPPRKPDYGRLSSKGAREAREARAEARANYHLARTAWRNAQLEYIRTVPWIRWSQPQLSGDRPCTGAESVSVFHATGARGQTIIKHWNGPGSLTHFARRSLRGADKHPTEKPLDLMLDLVCYFSDPGETVLDLCAGRGTTALAARLLGRECIAIDNDPAEVALAALREHAPLSGRDLSRAVEWCLSVDAEARTVPAPRGDHDVRTWERAQRRLADVARVAEAIA